MYNCGGGGRWGHRKGQRSSVASAGGSEIFQSDDNGRTFESIGRPLPGRLNIVISKTLCSDDERISVFGDLPSAISFLEQKDGVQRCFVIGGAQLYAEAMGIADKLYITRILSSAPAADRHFPSIDPSTWRQDSVSPLHTDPETGIAFTFDIYSRRV